MIAVHDLVRRFGRVTALSGVSFEVARGEIVALLGPNGAGKTTASRIIAAILAPSGGDVTVDGYSVRTDPNAVRSRCGLVTDQPSLYERMTLRAYLTFFGRLFDIADPAPRVDALARLLGLDGVVDRKLGTYSRGMKQKAAIARALVHDPPALLLDEPAAALDPEMARTLRELIVSLRADRRAILLCTHDLDEAQRIADRVVILDRGRIVRAGSPAQLRGEGRPRYRLELAGRAETIAAALERARVPAERTSEDGMVVARYETDDPARTNAAALRELLADGIGVLAVVRETRSLEEAYLDIIKGARE